MESRGQLMKIAQMTGGAGCQIASSLRRAGQGEDKLRVLAGSHAVAVAGDPPDGLVLGLREPVRPLTFGGAAMDQGPAGLHSDAEGEIVEKVDGVKILLPGT